MNNKQSHIPQGYKQSPLGIIPQEWQVKRLGEVFDNLPSYSYSRDQMTNEPQEFRYIHYGDIHRNETLDFVDLAIRELPFLVDDIAQQRKHNTLNNGDILLADASEDYDGVGKSIEVMNNCGQPIIPGLHTIALRPKQGFLRIGFGRYIFRSHNGKKSITRIAQGTKVYSISYNLISPLYIPLPPLAEQEKIAEVLSVWDEAIERQAKLTALLEKRKQALMQRLLTTKHNSQNHKALKKYIVEISERKKQQKDLPVLSVTNSRGFINQVEQFDREVASADSSNYKVIRRGQFAYNPSRVNVGSLDLLRSFEVGILSPMYVVFQTIEDKLSSTYLYYLLKSNWFTAHIPMYVQGSVRDSLSFDGLRDMKFYIPPLPEQTAIAEVLSTADSEITLARKKLESLRTQKKGLMQQLLTGKKRVKI